MGLAPDSIEELRPQICIIDDSTSLDLEMIGISPARTGSHDTQNRSVTYQFYRCDRLCSDLSLLESKPELYIVSFGQAACYGSAYRLSCSSMQVKRACISC